MGNKKYIKYYILRHIDENSIITTIKVSKLPVKFVNPKDKREYYISKIISKNNRNKTERGLTSKTPISYCKLIEKYAKYVTYKNY